MNVVVGVPWLAAVCKKGKRLAKKCSVRVRMMA
jgi:hypothetical protein